MNKSVKMLLILKELEDTKLGLRISYLCIKYETSYRTIRRYLSDFRAAEYDLIDLRSAMNNVGLYKIKGKYIKKEKV